MINRSSSCLQKTWQEEALQDSCNKDQVCGKSSKNYTVGNECLEAGKGFDNRVSDIKNKTISSELVRSAFKVCQEKENKSNQSNCCTYLKQNTIMWIKRVVLILICVAVAGGFTVPIIIYAVDMDRGDNSTISIDLDVDKCQLSDSDVQVCYR